MAFISAELPKYQHSCVRDLAWLLSSASLFNSALASFDAFIPQQYDSHLLEWLTTVDHTLIHQPDAYPEISPQHFRRIGLYAEALLAFYFEQGKKRGLGYEVLGRNIALRDKHSTLGECDLLIRDLAGDIIHLELAVKFYLHIPFDKSPHGLPSPWHHWVGPNSRDRLDLKLKRMLEHQLPLLQSDKAREIFAPVKASLGIDREITSKHIIKGRLYFPYANNKSLLSTICSGKALSDINRRHSPLPNQANPKTEQGLWMHRQEFIDFSQSEEIRDSDIRAIVCDKMDWLAGPNLHLATTDQGQIGEEHTIGEIDLQEVLNKLDALYALAVKAKRRLPPLMILLRMSDSDNFFPIMLVPDTWPDPAI